MKLIDSHMRLIASYQKLCFSEHGLLGFVCLFKGVSVGLIFERLILY